MRREFRENFFYYAFVSAYSVVAMVGSQLQPRPHLAL